MDGRVSSLSQIMHSQAVLGAGILITACETKFGRVGLIVCFGSRAFTASGTEQRGFLSRQCRRLAISPYLLHCGHSLRFFSGDVTRGRVERSMPSVLLHDLEGSAGGQSMRDMRVTKPMGAR